jgi:hypothetical protein
VHVWDPHISHHRSICHNASRLCTSPITRCPSLAPLQEDTGFSRAIDAADADTYEEVDYEAAIHTAPALGSGTQANVFIALEGSAGTLCRVRSLVSCTKINAGVQV